MQEQLEYLAEVVSRLEEKTLNPQALSDAVAAGMRQAVSSPEFWDDGLAAMGKHTKEAAGGFLLQGVGGAFKKSLLFIGAGLLVYSVGGWSGLASLFKTVFGFEGLKP